MPGAVISPETVRKLACDATMIPVAITLPLAPLGGTPTRVHTHGFTAIVTTTDVTWHT